MNDYYGVLGLSRQAEDAEVAKAYRRYALAYNPECHQDGANGTASMSDLSPAERAERFRLVSCAYVVLSDPKARAIYDLYGDEGVRHGGTGAQGIPGGLDLDRLDPQVVFNRFFGVDNPFQIIGNVEGVKGNQHEFFSHAAVAQKTIAKSPPMEVLLPITLEDVFFGAVRRVTWTASLAQPAPAASPAPAAAAAASSGPILVSESFDVSVPKGARNGNRYVVAGKGNGSPQTARGDVYVVFSLQPHPRYTREGDDLVVTVPITLCEALCGTMVRVRTMEDRELSVLIDQIVHPGYRSRVAGEGLPRGDGGEAAGRGDLLVEFDTKFPPFLTLEQKSELRRILVGAQAPAKGN